MKHHVVARQHMCSFKQNNDVVLYEMFRLCIRTYVSIDYFILCCFVSVFVLICELKIIVLVFSYFI